MEEKKVRVRIAPSPTGSLHVGTARAALFNWLFAKHNNGKFILRIEDTDLEKSDEKFEKDIIDGLKWLGIEWDEFYKQSERKEIYKKYIQKVLDEKKAFYCGHSIEELEAEKKKQMEKKEAPRHICEHKDKNLKEGIIRLKVDQNSTRVINFKDAVRKNISFEQKTIGDLSLAKDLDTPLYNFAVVVDDNETKISHVIRGEDHIPNTPKQILIAEALGFNLPQYAHLPLILGEDKSKLSKRHGATSIKNYKDQGFLPEAVVNYLALLGWAPDNDDEILSVDNIVEKFDLLDVHKSGAVFDIKKLKWMNSEYIKKMSKDKLVDLVLLYTEKDFDNPKEILSKIINMVQERMETLEDIKEFHFFFKEPNYKKDLLIWKKGSEADTKKALKLIEKKLGSNVEWKEFDNKYMRSELDSLAEKNFGGDRGMVYWPMRVALSGEKFSPDPIEIAEILGKKSSINRIKKAIEKLS